MNQEELDLGLSQTCALPAWSGKADDDTLSATRTENEKLVQATTLHDILRQAMTEQCMNLTELAEVCLEKSGIDCTASNWARIIRFVRAEMYTQNWPQNLLETDTRAVGMTSRTQTSKTERQMTEVTMITDSTTKTDGRTTADGTTNAADMTSADASQDERVNKEAANIQGESHTEDIHGNYTQGNGTTLLMRNPLLLQLMEYGLLDVSAPSGYGKTSLAVDLCHSWLLAHPDNRVLFIPILFPFTPQRFLSSLLKCPLTRFLFARTSPRYFNEVESIVTEFLRTDKLPLRCTGGSLQTTCALECTAPPASQLLIVVDAASSMSNRENRKLGEYARRLYRKKGVKWFLTVSMHSAFALDDAEDENVAAGVDEEYSSVKPGVDDLWEYCVKCNLRIRLHAGRHKGPQPARPANKVSLVVHRHPCLVPGYEQGACKITPKGIIWE